MKAHLFCLCLTLATLSPACGQQSDEATSRQQAVVEFPELSLAGSPLNQKFLTEYNRLKTANAPLLSRPDWPLVLARKCAAEMTPPIISRASPEVIAAEVMAENSKVEAATANDKATKEKAAAVTLVGNVIQKVPGGLLVECVQPRAPIASGSRRVGGGGGAFYGIGPDSDVFGIFFLKGHPKQKDLVDDDVVACKAVPDGQYSRGGETRRAYRCTQVVERKLE